ncbi:MAG: hypothetical protein MJZ38_03975 [archaeon]|nr:hypothetical protein [archaeon]
MAAFTIKDVTVKDRILLHLARFNNIMPGQEYNVPFDLTQDGIAMVVGITRSHASLDLKKLGESGMITNWQAHQKGVRTRRLVYTITSAGLEKAEQTRTRLEKEGINVDVILDMKKCDPEVKWNALSPEDREVFGKVCVFRVPVPRDEFPPTPTGTLPVDFFGMISIPPEVARVYLEKVPQEDVRRWNSWAADWWLKNDNPQERLYHLIAAGRSMEAGKLAVRHEDRFLSNPNEDLLELLNAIPLTGSLEEDLLWIKSQVAYACRDVEEMKRCAKALESIGTPMYKIVDAQLSMIRNDHPKAFKCAKEAYDVLHCPLAAILMSQACARMGDLKAADDLAVEACDAMNRIGDAQDIDEILRARAEIAYMRGDRDTATALLGKAKAAAPQYKKSVLQNLIDSLADPESKICFN